LLSDVCLKNQKLNEISGPLAICIEKGGLLILRRENVPNNVLEGLNNFWSDDFGERFQGYILHHKLQVILISDINAPQLSPAASGRFQHLLLHPKTIFPVVTLETKEIFPTDEAIIIDLAFKDVSEVQAQLIGALKREEKTYAWTWQEGELALLRKKSAPFPVFSTRFLRRQVIRPILNKFLSQPFYLSQTNLDLIEKTLLELYKKTPLLEPNRRLDSRTLTAICSF